MDDSLISEYSGIEQSSNQLREQLAFIDNELSELEKFKESIVHLSKTNETEIISSLGKGVHVKTILTSKDFFVEVGSGVVVKKSITETSKDIDNQINKLNQARQHILMQLEYHHDQLRKIIQKIEKSDFVKHNH